MKRYKLFVILFIVLFAVYAVMKITAPKNIQWNISLRNNDKAPFGSYILYHSLDSLFPQTTVHTFRKPFYNFINEAYNQEDSVVGAYFAIAPTLDFSKAEAKQLFNFVSEGNYVFLSAEEFNGAFFDSLGLKTAKRFQVSIDSSNINFVNPAIKQDKGYSYKSAEIDLDLIGNYFDSLPLKYPVKILGIVDKNNRPDFAKIEIGKGVLLLHASPIVFTNAFLLNKNNSTYVEKALSYIPYNIRDIYWDSYYSQGSEGASTPFRYILNNFWLRTGFYLAWFLLFVYVFFDGKRRQRVIPVIMPPKNATYQFINTIAALYFNRNSSNEIARKKINYWEAFVRNRYHYKEIKNEDEFITDLAGKSGADKLVIASITRAGTGISAGISNKELMDLFNNIQTFYQQAKA